MLSIRKIKNTYHYIKSLIKFIYNDIKDVMQRHHGFYSLNSDREIFDISYFIRESKFDEIEIIYDNDTKECYFMCDNEHYTFEEIDNISHCLKIANLMRQELIRSEDQKREEMRRLSRENDDFDIFEYCKEYDEKHEHVYSYIRNWICEHNY